MSFRTGPDTVVIKYYVVQDENQMGHEVWFTGPCLADIGNFLLRLYEQVKDNGVTEISIELNTWVGYWLTSRKTVKYTWKP